LTHLKVNAARLTVGVYTGTVSLVTATITSVGLGMDIRANNSKKLNATIGDLSVISEKIGLWPHILKFDLERTPGVSSVLEFGVDIHGIPKGAESYPGYDIALCTLSLFPFPFPLPLSLPSLSPSLAPFLFPFPLSLPLLFPLPSLSSSLTLESW
jgi:hypothetical protein